MQHHIATKEKDTKDSPASASHRRQETTTHEGWTTNEWPNNGWHRGQGCHQDLPIRSPGRGKCVHKAGLAILKSPPEEADVGSSQWEVGAAVTAAISHISLPGLS